VLSQQVRERGCCRVENLAEVSHDELAAAPFSSGYRQ